MKNTITMEEFFKNSENLINLYKSEVRYILYQSSIDELQKENNAIRELLSNSKNDLDISKFRNRFSSNFLKELNITQISEINQKYPFFENFINKMHNVAIEVETHTDTNALLINRNEFDEATKILIRDFIVYDTNNIRNNHLSFSSQKFGYCFKIKKLVIWLRAYKNKLVEFDNDLEKISNAKFAISNNKLVFEMDNLYRQLKVLKDNIKVMEFYIKDYFNDKFNNLISSYQTELSQIEAQFSEFRKDIEVQLKQKITEHYNDCINRLREVTKKVNSISDVNVEQNQEFYENFDRGLTVNQSHHEELNKGRKEIENLQNDIAKLHGFYRMKMHNQRVEFENELDNLRKNLSNNQDLWDKLAIAERNETVLKEELSKTQKSLAAAEEFIKKLRGQIRNSHDKNVALEKKISQMTIKDIMRNAGKGSSAKAVELYDQIKQTYVYNMKNNVNLITAIEKIKMKYEKDEDIKILLTNFEILQKKYAEEIEAKRSFIATLNGIKGDVQKMNAISNKKLEEVTNNYNEIKKENENLKIELDKMKLKNSVMMNNSRKFMGTTEKEIKIMTNNMSRSSAGTLDKFPLIEK
jgi:chromosome segregation ATPase